MAKYGRCRRNAPRRVAHVLGRARIPDTTASCVRGHEPRGAPRRRATFRQTLLEDVEERPAVVGVDAGAQVQREPEIAVPEPPLARPLLDRVHGEAPRTSKPFTVSRPPVELEKGPAVAGGSMAEACVASYRPRFPDELARCEQQARRACAGTEPRRERTRLPAPRGTTAPGPPSHRIQAREASSRASPPAAPCAPALRRRGASARPGDRGSGTAPRSATRTRSRRGRARSRGTARSCRPSAASTGTRGPSSRTTRSTTGVRSPRARRPPRRGVAPPRVPLRLRRAARSRGRRCTRAAAARKRSRSPATSAIPTSPSPKPTPSPARSGQSTGLPSVRSA